MKPQNLLLCVLFAAVSADSCAKAQELSAFISGSVYDSQDAAIQKAAVTLINQDQGSTVRKVLTDDDGKFVIVPVLPATYRISVEAPGFKTFVTSGLTVHANDKLALPRFTLEVGETHETVSVSADVQALQSASAERSAVIDSNQMREIGLNLRSYGSLYLLTPGFNQDTANSNGLRTDQNNLTIDGVTSMATAQNSTGLLLRINPDAIEEMKILTSGRQAEFGRSPGAQITLVTRSGTREFHGNGYWFYRHESLNANNWVNNATGVPNPIYRFTTAGFTLGGPVYIPKLFNRAKDRLFFFTAVEWQTSRSPSALLPTAPSTGATILTVPTVAERQGDFSSVTDASGKPVIVKDPASRSPFPGNRIPQSRWNPDGLAILKFFPLPNHPNDPSYNYTSNIPASNPKEDEVYKVDYNATSRLRVFFRLIRNTNNAVAPYGDRNYYTDNIIGAGAFVENNTAISGMANVTLIASPTLTNEFVYGNSRHDLPAVAANNAWSRSAAGLTFQPLFPNADPSQMVPNMSFGGVPNAPSSNFQGIPFVHSNPSQEFTDNLSKVFAGHNVKTGFFFLSSLIQQSASGYVNGNLSFGIDPSNPGDTGWAYSNALLGNFQSFQQASAYRVGNYRANNIEWYIQDNWKIRNNVTLDYGIRFILNPPMYEEGNQVSGFNPALYDPSQRVYLYQKTLAGGKTASLNPLTGAIGPAYLVGAIVPGVGNPNDGIAVAGQNGYPRGLIHNRGLLYGPRFGAAWVPGGVGGKTVVRLGGGIYYERTEGFVLTAEIGDPPGIRVPQVYYGNLATLGQSGGILFPSKTFGLSLDGHVPTIYNYHLAVQRELPMNIILDTAYVGSLSRHLVAASGMVNEPAFGSAWLPQNQDPTVAPKFDGTTTLPVDFTRPYPGYGQIEIFGFGSSANYNALQVSATRRSGKSLEFGATYTWSKALGTSSAYNSILNPLNFRKANYGPLSQDRTHVANFNYIYQLPDPSRRLRLNNFVGRMILGGWEFEGIVSLSTGGPIYLNYSVLGLSNALVNRETTGSETQAPVPVLTGNPNLPASQRTVHAYFNTSVFRPAPRGSTGMDSGFGVLRGPGGADWDASIFKKFPILRGERRFIQLRLEAFNALNHPQFSSVNSTPVFNASGQIVNLPGAVGGTGGQFGFGALTASRNARIVQIAAKLYF